MCEDSTDVYWLNSGSHGSGFLDVQTWLVPLVQQGFPLVRSVYQPWLHTY